jgi:hypothetical protein
MNFTMKNQGFVLVAFVLAMAAMLAGNGAVHAEEISCTGSLGAITVDNVRVPEGRSCTMTNTRVQGTITVEKNATLSASNVQVVGNIQAEGAKNVKVNAKSRIGGSIQIVQGQAAAIDRAFVNGDILFDENRGYLSATRNAVGGDVQAFQNSGGVKIASNTIDGNLQCKENTPRPTGGSNIVQGSKEDQCSRL